MDTLAPSGGGVTFSGGEPTVQGAFLTELLTLCRQNGIRTALETNGCIPEKTLRAILPLVDLWLLDLKADHAEQLRAWTGGDYSLWQNTLDAIERAALLEPQERDARLAILQRVFAVLGKNRFISVAAHYLVKHI